MPLWRATFCAPPKQETLNPAPSNCCAVPFRPIPSPLSHFVPFCPTLHLLLWPQIFQQVGPVVELVVVRDKFTHESKGSAFVWYATRHDADNVSGGGA